MQTRRIMHIHRKPLRLMLGMTALALLLSILMACDTDATPAPEATPVAEQAAVSAPRTNGGQRYRAHSQAPGNGNGGR